MIDVFKVGVHIGMSTNASQILSTMLRELTGIHIAAGKVEKGLASIQKAALGAAAVFAGWEVMKGLYDATKHAEKLNHELVKLQTGARLTDTQTNDASNLAFRISRNVRGTNVADNVRMQRELFGVFGNMDEAKEMLPLVAQGSRATSAFVDKDTDLAKIAVRALELRGHITQDGKVNPEEFQKEFGSLVRSIVASEGLIDPAKLLQFIQQAGPAARGMNSDEFWGKSPAIMNAMGASKSGTAMMSLFSQMVGHVVAGRRVAVAMEEADMLKPGSWHTGSGGKVEMDRDATPDTAGFIDHPYTWLHEKMVALRAKPGMDEVGVIQRIFQFSSRATSARLIADLDKNWPIIENEEKRYQRMPGPAGIAKEQNDKDLSVNVHNLSEAWENFMTALGKPGIPILIGVFTHLTDALNLMQAAAINHPQAAAEIEKLIGEVAALIALSGSIVLFNIAMGPFVAGLRLLVGLGPSMGVVGTGLGVVAAGFSALLGPLAAVAVAVSHIEGIAKMMPGSGHTSLGDGIGNALGDLAKGKLPSLSGPNLNSSDSPIGKGNVPWSGKTYGPNSLPLAPTPGKQSSVDGPILVHVANANDIGRGMIGGLSDGAARPQSGPTGQDWRFDVPQPGLGNLA